MKDRRSASCARLRLLAVMIAAIAGITSAGWADARQNGKPAIGFLAFAESGCKNAAFHRGMKELGYEDGKNWVFKCVHSDGKYERLDAAAAKVAAMTPDIFVVFGHAPTKAAQRATKTIPIVMSASGEPVEMKIVQSLARPGGNITGVSYYANELNSKRLEFLASMVPGFRRLGMLLHRGLPRDLAEAYIQNSAETGKVLGFSSHVVEYSSAADIDKAFGEMRRLGVQGVFVAPTREVKAEIQRIAELGLKFRLPVVHFRKSFPAAGGLMSYGPDYNILYHRTAWYVDRILKGARPADLPVEQPARFELHVNTATAKALGLKVPESLLLLADKVIE
jgi:putative ABC transport system substrate-binding protein